MAKGIVKNISANPVELPDGSMLGAGETREDFDESTLGKDNLFVNGGWLVVGKDAKALQAQLDTSGEEVAELQKQVADLQDSLQKETLRANEAQAKADAADPAKLEELNKSVADLQDSLQKETLRANEAQAKADAADPAKLEELNKSVADLTARAEKAEQALADKKK